MNQPISLKILNFILMVTRNCWDCEISCPILFYLISTILSTLGLRNQPAWIYFWFPSQKASYYQSWTSLYILDTPCLIIQCGTLIDISQKTLGKPIIQVPPWPLFFHHLCLYYININLNITLSFIVFRLIVWNSTYQNTHFKSYKKIFTF